MAKQVRGAPIASAGVERIFSSAGMFHDDKSKQQDVGLLKALLFASYYYTGATILLKTVSSNC